MCVCMCIFELVTHWSIKIYYLFLLTLEVQNTHSHNTWTSLLCLYLYICLHSLTHSLVQCTRIYKSQKKCLFLNSVAYVERATALAQANQKIPATSLRRPRPFLVLGREQVMWQDSCPTGIIIGLLSQFRGVLISGNRLGGHLHQWFHQAHIYYSLFF